MSVCSSVYGDQAGNHVSPVFRHSAHRSKWSLWASSCQSLPLALAVSKVAQILWRMDRGILKALGPVCDVMLQSRCIKNGTFSVWRNRRQTDCEQTEDRTELQIQTDPYFHQHGRTDGQKLLLQNKVNSNTATLTSDTLSHKLSLSRIQTHQQNFSGGVLLSIGRIYHLQRRKVLSSPC